MKPRTIGAIVAGFAACEAIVLLCLFVARTGWPDYALAEPTRAYSLTMLFARLSAGSLAALTGGATATLVDRGGRPPAALVFGVILLLLSVAWHIQIWSQYPVWYHLCWFACIVPFAVLGGRLTERRMKMAALNQ